jgi:hypothetical protein
VKIKVRYKKLWRQKVNGIAYVDKGLIELDERLRGKQFLEYLIHEIMHIQNPEWTEETVLKKSEEMANVLWDEGVRPVENQTKYL